MEPMNGKTINNSSSNVQIIVLDVEGVFFKTRITTLKSVKGTFFTKLFETNWKDKLDRDGRLFIDRDASVFPIILNYLRDHDKYPLPKDDYQLQRILREAVFFNIIPLRNIIEHKLRPCTSSMCTCPPELPATPIPNKDNNNGSIISSKVRATKPPPPPPPPLPHILTNSTFQSSSTVQIPMRKTHLERERSSKKLKTSADSISLPRNFTHIAHVGWNGSSVLFDKNMGTDETVKKICDAAAEAVDLNAVYNVVNKNENEESDSVEVLITGGVMQSREGSSRH